jgi:calcium-dependent protein kinase
MYGSNNEYIDQIYNRIDVDNSGQIDYTEWVIATIDKDSLLTEDKLRTAFNMIDDDGSGTITSHEIRDVICAGNQNIDPVLWDQMVMEVDLDGNGEIDFDEFKVVMRNIILRPNKDK